MTGLSFDIPATNSITNIELRPKEYEIQVVFFLFIFLYLKFF